MYMRFKSSQIRGGGCFYYLFPENHTGNTGSNPYYVTTNPGDIALRLVELGRRKFKAVNRMKPDDYTEIIEFETEETSYAGRHIGDLI